MAYDIFSGEQVSRDWSCGAGDKISMSLKQAVDIMQKRYAALSAQGARLVLLTRKLGKSLPARVMADYQAAVADYMKFGRQVFDVLAKHNIKVDQTPFHDGKPVPDPSKPGKFKTLRISAPLLPPMFSSTTSGALPLVVAAAPAVATAGVWAWRIGWIILSSIAVVGIDKIRLSIWGPDYSPDKSGDAFLKIVDKLVAAGYPVEKAVEAASKTIGISPDGTPSGGGGGGGDDLWKWLALAGGGAVAFTLVVKKMGSR